jgi:dTDP-4-dehydrorhamnose 3,5-epimerase
MKVTDCEFEGVKLFHPAIHDDERGCFIVPYSKVALMNNGINDEFVQDNFSESTKGVFRGFHLQTKNPQSKYVRVASGIVLDVIIDLRKDSETYLKSASFILSSHDHPCLYIPRGFAHGFLTLSDFAAFEYKVDNYYDADGEDGISIHDPDLKSMVGLDIARLFQDCNVDIDDVITSEKDTKYKTLKENLKNITYHG